MSRKPTEIQPIRAERLKELIKDLNMSQTDFSKSVNYSQQHISGIINQKTALTEETAQDIISVYPDYRIEWLLGYDDIHTHNEWADRWEEQREDFFRCCWWIFENSLKKKELTLRFVHPSYVTNLCQGHRHSDRCYYSVVDKDGNEVKRLSIKKMTELEQKLLEYGDFLTHKYIL